MNINMIQEIVEKNGIVFLTYGGFLSQALISSMTEALEKEVEENNLNMGDSSDIFTIFIELTQNMMNYSKTKSEDNNDLRAEGLIIVSKDDKLNYSIHSQNVIGIEDKNKIEAILENIKTLNKDEIKKKYRELRRSGKNTHGKGGGIGFYEIAKRSSKITFEFKQINKNKYYFHFVSKVNTNKEK